MIGYMTDMSWLKKNTKNIFTFNYNFSNQGQPMKFSTNLWIKIVEVNNSFPTNYPCDQAVHYKSNRLVVI